MKENKGAAEVAERKEGYYWVKINEDGEWVIGYWIGGYVNNSYWVSPSGRGKFYDRELFEIDERQICRS